MLQQYKEVITDCDRAIQLDRACTKAYFRKATALKSMGKIEEALAVINAGLEHDATNGPALQEKKVLTAAKAKIAEMEHYFATGQFTSALILVDQLTNEIGTGNREVNLRRVECLIKVKRLEEAFNLTNQMVRLV